MRRLLVAIAASALAACSSPSTPANTPPTNGTIQVTPSAAGLINATTFTLAASGVTDSDGDTITFAWDFGDGTTGTGSTTTHSYTTAGAFTVKLTANDGHNTPAQVAQTTITTHSLTATWQGTVTCIGATCLPATRTVTLVLIQAGISISRSCTDSHVGTSGPITVQSFAIDPATGLFPFTGSCASGFEGFGMKYDPVADTFTVSNWDSPPYAGTLTRH